jgi:hypothetical protein
MLTLFVSVLIAAGALWFFVWNVHQGTHEHAERLELLPLEDDAGASQPITKETERHGTDTNHV